MHQKGIMQSFVYFDLQFRNKGEAVEFKVSKFKTDKREGYFSQRLISYFLSVSVIHRKKQKRKKSKNH